MNGRRPKLAEWWKGALEKYKYALLIVAAGVALMLLPAGGEQIARGEQRFIPFYCEHIREHAVVRGVE